MIETKTAQLARSSAVPVVTLPVFRLVLKKGRWGLIARFPSIETLRFFNEMISSYPEGRHLGRSRHSAVRIFAGFASIRSKRRYLLRCLPGRRKWASGMFGSDMAGGIRYLPPSLQRIPVSGRLWIVAPIPKEGSSRAESVAVLRYSYLPRRNEPSTMSAVLSLSKTWVPPVKPPSP